MHKIKRKLKYLCLKAQFWAYKEVYISDNNIDFLSCDDQSEIPLTTLNIQEFLIDYQKKYVYQKFSYFEPSKPYMFTSIGGFNIGGFFRLSGAPNIALMHKSDIFLYKLMS